MIVHRVVFGSVAAGCLGLLLSCGHVDPPERLQSDSPASVEQQIEREFQQKRQTRPSVSLGTVNDGRLRNASALENPGGFGYRLYRPDGRGGRGVHYGTDEMVAGLKLLAARVHRDDAAGRTLVIADIGHEQGGQISGHASHESGRDVDLLFFYTDLDGNAIESPHMVRVDGEGRSTNANYPILFDAAGNWLIVKHILRNPYFELDGSGIRFILIDEDVKPLILAAAHEELERTRGAERQELEELIARADDLMRHWPNHDHHYHLRIHPTREDREQGAR